MAEQETTQGTTPGGKYLTRSYLVRNLQNFWNRIKKYVIDQKFVNEDTFTGALRLKVDQSELDSLTATVNDKVSQGELTKGLAGKVDAVSGKGLSTNDFTTVEKEKLEGLRTYDIVNSSENGLMLASDKAKLDRIDDEATKVVVDATWNPNSENPAQSKAISAELNKKADIEDLEDSSNLSKSIIKSYSTREGHIVLSFSNRIDYFKLYTPESDRPVEKISLKDGDNVVFTNFSIEDGKMLAVIENPEGKIENTWKINAFESFQFYIKEFKYNSQKYKPFILQATRIDENDLTKIDLEIIKVF